MNLEVRRSGHQSETPVAQTTGVFPLPPGTHPTKSCCSRNPPTAMIFKPRPACGDDTGPLFDFGSPSTAYRRRRKDPAVVQKNTFLNARLHFGIFWHPLHASSASTILFAMAIGCAANWRRNRTFHCAISGPVLLVSACVFLLSGVTAYRVNVFWVWIFVLTGVGVAFLLEWRYARRPASRS